MKISQSSPIHVSLILKPLQSSHLHPLQVENCTSNSRLVVDEDDNDKFRLERVNIHFKNATTYNIFSKQTEIAH